MTNVKRRKIGIGLLLVILAILIVTRIFILKAEANTNKWLRVTFYEPKPEVSYAVAMLYAQPILDEYYLQCTVGDLETIVGSSTQPAVKTPYNADLSEKQLSQAEIIAYLDIKSAENGINPELVKCLVEHESRYDPTQKGLEPDGTYSRGLWQIHAKWHPEVSNETAYSVTRSTEWSLDRIRAGYVNEWATYKKYCDQYEVFIN